MCCLLNKGVVENKRCICNSKAWKKLRSINNINLDYLCIDFLMKKISLIASLLISVQISSCKKAVETNTTNEPVYHFIQYHLQDTLSGTVYVDCNLHPDINQKVTIIISSTDIDVLMTDTIATITTDSAGHFSYPINYSVTSSETPSYLFKVDTIYEIFNWPLKSPFSIIIHDTARVAINIIATNAHTASDTLYYAVGNSAYYHLVGPFTTGLINMINVPQSFYFSDTSGVSILWAIGYNNIFGNNNMNAVYTSFSVKHVGCSPSDTAIIRID